MSNMSTPNGAPPIVCLVSSVGSRMQLEIARTWLTLQGYVVIDIECPNHRLDRLDALSQSKLEMSSEIIVLNSDGCINELMRVIIRNAQRLSITVRFYAREHFQIQASLPTSDRLFNAQGLNTQPNQEVCESGNVISLDAPFVVKSGAVMLFGPDATRPAFTLVADHVWPGIQFVPEVWYAESISNTVIEPVEANNLTLQSVGHVIRWAVTTSGQVMERLLCALQVLGSVHTQEEVSGVIGCRRESVTAAMRDLKAGGLVEKANGRIRLTAKGIVAALHIFDPMRLEEDEPELAQYDLPALNESAQFAAF
jgi:hypothetical protein